MMMTIHGNNASSDYYDADDSDNDDDNTNNKQLLDEVFVISRIIKVEVSVISRSRRLRLITLTRFHLSLPSFKSLFGSLVEVVLSCREFISPVLLTFKTTLQ